MKKKNELSTFDKMMKEPEFKAKFEEGYEDFLLLELLIDLIDNNQKSISEIAKEANINPSLIQDICNNTKQDIKISQFLKVIKACDYNLILEKGENRIFL